MQRQTSSEATTDHFKRLLEKACPNNAYLIRHKLNDCNMMRSFMASGSLTWGAELDEGPDGSDMMHFLEENVVLTVYRGRPTLGRHSVSNLSPRAPTHCDWGHGAQGCNGTSFPTSLYIYIYIYITAI
jgi:hypothetical protein